MKRKYLFISSITIMLISIVVICFVHLRSIAQPQGSTNSRSVIELFTSEGCSSCPAADKLVAEIQQNHTDVLVLCYHVDYWNHLGWKDTYSSAKNTARQRYYTGIFKLDGAYTPQAVINGEQECVGSDKGTLLHAINNKALSATSDLRINAIIKGKSIEVNCTAEKTDNNIVVCLVQKQASTHVKNGENEGRILNHINLVRDFKIATGKQISFELPEGVDKSNIFVAALLQDKKTGNISGYNTSEIK